MASRKVGVYRKYLEPVPLDLRGEPMAKDRWPKKRRFCWVARWFSAAGKRYSRSFQTKGRAQAFAARKQAEIQNARDAGLTDISLQDFCNEHQQLGEGSVAARTLSLHLATLRMLAMSVGWERSLRTITARDIEAFRASRLASGVSAGTVNKDLAVLRRLFNLALLRGYLSKDTNPCDGIGLLRVGSVRRSYISPAEFAALYCGSTDSFWRTLLATLYAAGLRLREATHLTWDDIDLEAGRLHIASKRACGLVQAWRPKSYQTRTIPLPRQTANLLAAWKSVAPPGCPYVFMQQGRWDYYRDRVEAGQWQQGQDLINNLLRRFRTLCRRAGLGPYSFQDLRRSCITNWARSLPMYVVRELAGHSDIRTTQRYYLLVQQQDLQKSRTVQESLLPPIRLEDLTNPKAAVSQRRRAFPARPGYRQKQVIRDLTDSSGTSRAYRTYII